MRLLRDTSCLLLGVLLGTSACFALTWRVAAVDPVDVVSLASLAVFVMLLGSLEDPWRPTPATT